MSDEAGVEQPQEESRHDVIAAAFDAKETEQAQEQPEVDSEAITEQPEQTTERPRDEQGRFVSTKEDEPEQVIEEQPQVDTRQYPDSWKKGLEEQFNSIPDEVYEEILRREGNIKEGFEQNKSKLDYYNEMNDALSPYMATINAMGISPAQAAQKLFNADHVLRTAPPSQRQQYFQQLAKSYGIEMGQEAEQPNDPNVTALQDEVHRLRQQIESSQSHGQQAQLAAQNDANSEVERFRSQNPDFDQYRLVMAGLIESGQASDLQTAYDLAKRTNTSGS